MERWKHWPKNFHPKPMDSVEFGTRRLEFGAQLLQCSANDFSLKVLSCGDGGHGHIWIFFCDANPPITLLLTFCPGFKFPESDFFIFLFRLPLPYSQLLHTKYFLQEKIKLTFCWRHHFLCVDPWPEPQMFYTTLCWPKLCFTKPVFCQYPLGITQATVLFQHPTIFALWVLSK